MSDVRIEVEGLRSLLRMLNRAPREVSREVRRASKSVAEMVASDARRRARQSHRQLAVTAPTIRAVSDRVPSVRVGGAKKVTSSGATAGQVYFGAEWGSHRWPQFPEPRRSGRALYPAIAANRAEAADAWLDAIERVFLSRRDGLGVR